MYRSLVVILAIFCFSGSARAESDCSIADTALKEASTIRGLRIKKKVPCRLQSKTEVERYLRETLDKKVPPEQLAREESIFKFLGLIPSDYDYREGVIKLYREQIGGYYESSTDYYVMADWMPEILQLPIAIHELTHALQDQHFDLSKIIEDKGLTMDQQLARSALVEGDASAVMLDFSGRTAGAPNLAKQDSVSSFMMQNILGASFTSALQSAPPALQTLMIFPYISGLNYAHRLLRRGGYQAIDRTFANPPSSTREILHNDIGFVPATFTPPTMEEEAEDMKRASSETDSLGEFVTSTMLGVYISPFDASTAARGWIGDRLDLTTFDDGTKTLYWQTRWEDERESDEFYRHFVAAQQKRFQIKDAPPAQPEVQLSTPYDLFKISKHGSSVFLKIVDRPN